MSEPASQADLERTDDVSLTISGEVERPLSFSLADLRAIAEDELVADFHCVEGWSRLGQRSRGVRLARLLALAAATTSGRYVTIASGDFTVVLSRDEAEDERVLVATDQPGHSGGLPRLVGPSDWDCFKSVKSVDRIELTREPGRATAGTIALARIGRDAPEMPGGPATEP
jgi:DMSO/TMAO reductase YedYZ molybdopterin-dependent catalytic subunit